MDAGDDEAVSLERARDEVTKEPLIESLFVLMQESNSKRHMRDLVDARAGAWDAKAWRKLMAVAWRCLEERVGNLFEQGAVAGVS